MGRNAVGRAVRAGLWLAAVCAWSLPARAVPVLDLKVPRLLNADVPVLPSGVLIFSYQPGSLTLEDLTITVTDGSGTAVAGALEQLPADVPRVLGREYVFWRPVAPFAPATMYALSIVNADNGDQGGNTFTTQALDRELVIEPAAVRAMLATELRDGPLDICCARDDGQAASCFAPAYVPYPVARAVIERGDDPVLRQVLFASSAADQPAQFLFVDDRLGLGSIAFTEQRPEYCVPVEVYDAVARQRRTLPDACVTHDPSLFDASDAEAKTLDELATPLDVRGCHVPPSDFVAEWCEVNEDHCATFTSAACDEHERLCGGMDGPDASVLAPDPTQPPDVVGGPEPTADAGAGVAAVPEPDPGEPGTSGCGCEVRRSPLPRSAVALLGAVLALVTIRRRATRS